MLYAYIDESGQEQTADWMAVGGFMGNSFQWCQVASMWGPAIAPRKSLHMSDLRFKRDRERRMLERAGAIPDKAGLVPLMAVVKVNDYLDMISGTIREQLWSGYTACCYALVFNALRCVPPNERLEVVFEDQQRYGENTCIALRTLAEFDHPELLTTDGKSKLAKWSYVPKGSTPLLEPADYFAYALLQSHRDKTSVRAQWSKPILNTMGGNCFGARLNRDLVREIFSKIIEDKGTIDYEANA